MTWQIVSNSLRLKAKRGACMNTKMNREREKKQRQHKHTKIALFWLNHIIAWTPIYYYSIITTNAFEHINRKKGKKPKYLCTHMKVTSMYNLWCLVWNYSSCDVVSISFLLFVFVCQAWETRRQKKHKQKHWHNDKRERGIIIYQCAGVIRIEMPENEQIDMLCGRSAIHTTKIVQRKA